MAIGDMVRVAKKFWLGGELLGPFPFLFEFDIP